MATFVYKARSKKGQLAEGDIDADSREEAAARLMEQGFFPSSLEEKKNSFSFSQIEDYLADMEKIKLEEIILFTSQMATLFRAGIPLVATFDGLIEQSSSKKFKNILIQIKSSVEEGTPLNAAMKEYPKVFPETYTNMIMAGEVSGSLDTTLVKLVSLMEMQFETANKIKEVTRYPKIIAASVAVAVTILMTFVVPKFISIFESAGLDLPLPTKILMVLNTLFNTYWYVLLGGAIGSYVLFSRYIATKSGRYNWHKFILKVPIMGNIMLKVTFAQFCTVLASMISSGVAILESIDVASRAAGNDFLREIFEQVGESVREGSGMAEPLKKHKIVPPIVIQMIGAGEGSGALDEMLEKVADYFNQEADRKINELSSLIEPIMLFILGGIVLFIALAIFMPMWDMTKMAG